MAFTFYSPISVNAAQVPSTQTDFPMLVSVTDARFKTVANSGHVQNSSGFDIRPYTDSTLTTAITGYELERYNASTGEVIMWVKVASLSSSTTPFVLAYGNSSLTTDGSSTTCWSNSFAGVYHLADGTTLSLLDSTGTSNATHTSASHVTATTGQIDGAGGFASASSQALALNSSGFTPTALTISAWVKGTTFPNDYNSVITKLASVGTDGFGIYVKSTGKLFCNVKATTSRAYDGTGSHTLTTGTWFLLHMTYDSSAGLVGYVNAASDGTQTASGAASTGTGATSMGRQESTATRYFNGVIDEGRLATVARSANWITTEYNNQSAPGTFETLGSEAAAPTTGNSGFLMFM